MFNGNFVATSCANLIKIGPVTPEIMRVTTALFWMKWQKRHISLNVSATTSPISTKLSALVDIYGHYKTDISFAVAKATLLL